MARWPPGQNSVPWLVLRSVGPVLSKRPALSGLFLALIRMLQSSAPPAAESDAMTWIGSMPTLPSAKFGAADTPLFHGQPGKVVHDLASRKFALVARSVRLFL